MIENMIELDLDSTTLVYKQIVEQICKKIKDHELKPGDKLPTERDLARQLNVSRGTVKNAYDELASNNIIEVIQGSGSYVYNDLDVYTQEERKMALRLIERMWDKLESWNLSQEEILHLIHLSAIKRAPFALSIPIAIIDCNPDSLGIFKEQLRYIPGISIHPFLVDTILTADDPLQLLGDFPLVLTTSSHYEKLAVLLQGSKLRLIAVAAAPSRQTIIDILALPKNISLGILCQSNKFSQIIIQQLELFSSSRSHYPVCFTSDIKQVSRFIDQYDVIIVPPNLPILDKIVGGKLAEQMRVKGKRIISFNYMFDKGSLLNVECIVETLSKERAKEYGLILQHMESR